MKIFYAPVTHVKPTSYKYISTNTTTLVNSDETVLVGIVVGTGAVSAVAKVYDGIDATGTLVATLSIPITQRPTTLFYNIQLTTGLTIVTSGAGAPKITILYS